MFDRARTAVVLIAAFTALTTPAAHASTGYFDYARAVGPDDNGFLTIDFKLTNLSIGARVTVTASAFGKATYACRNKGGNYPSDPKKQQEVRWVSISGDFRASLLGIVIGNLVLEPPPSSTLKCPRGQRVELRDVEYGRVTVAALGVTASIDGIFSRVLWPV